MPVWAWMLVGIGALFALSAIVALGVAAILANMGREVADLAELEPWVSSPMTHAEHADVRERASITPGPTSRSRVP